MSDCHIGWSPTVQHAITVAVQTHGWVSHVEDERLTDRWEPTCTTWYRLGSHTVRHMQFFRKKQVVDDLADILITPEKDRKYEWVESNPEPLGQLDIDAEYICGQCSHCSPFTPTTFKRAVRDLAFIQEEDEGPGCSCCSSIAQDLLGYLEGQLLRELCQQDTELGELARLLRQTTI